MIDNNRYLCFNLGDEEYAIPLLTVKEVIGLPETTPVPQSPAHFVGIMNLRGDVLSVLDLRICLGIAAKTTAETSTIILDLEGVKMGVVVDRINSVQLFQPDSISEKPVMQSTKFQESIVGVVRKDEKLVLILDVGYTLGQKSA